MYLGYEQIAVSTVVLDVDDLTIPANTTWAELQAETAGVRFTLDGATNPTTTTGMILQTGAAPTWVDGEDLRRIRFIRDGGADANLNAHYGAQRSV